MKVGADVNAKDEDGNTALMAAVDIGNEPWYSFFIVKGAEVNVRNTSGKTALYQAVIHGHTKFQAGKTKRSVEQRNTDLSPCSRIVYALLQVGTQVNAGSPDFNPTTAHLKPTKLIKPNTHILKMLFAAGAQLEYRLFISEETLQDLARKSIREHVIFHVTCSLTFCFIPFRKSKQTQKMIQKNFCPSLPKEILMGFSI